MSTCLDSILDKAMKKVFLLFACLMAAMQVCSAQTDTLIGKWGEAIPVKVKSFTKNGLRVDRQMKTVDDKLMHVKYTDLNALRFTDGFEVRFQDGALVRDNLLSAPSFRRSFMDVRAEGVLTLTQDELRQYYGFRNYDIVFKPYRNQFYTGFVKMGGGLLGFVASTELCEAWWSSGSQSVWSVNGEEKELLRRYYFEEGSLRPFWSMAAYFFLGTMVDGLVDCTVSELGHRKLFKHPEDVTVPTVAGTKGLLWGGIALSAAGIGALTLSYVDLKAHSQWDYRKTVPAGVDPDTVEYTKDGERPSSWVKYALIGGALAANLGFSAIQFGAIRLSALYHLEGTPDAVQIHVGPSPSGYGLTMRF